MDPYALIPILGIFFGSIILLVPIGGLTLRFAIQPLIERWAELRGLASGDENRIQMVERRMETLERQIEHLERENSRLVEEADFQRSLHMPAGKS